VNAAFPILALALSSLAVPAKGAEPVRTGMASWYGAECRKTASGESYDPNSMTAAHRTLPFGTMVNVQNLKTGCCATVRINNRGPFRKGRIIDVSRAAARQLEMIQSGTAKVKIAVIE